MGLFDKVKNLFTEEYEDEIKPIKKEVRHVDVTPATRSEREVKEEIKEEPKHEEEKKEEKFVFFSDDDFKDLEKPKREEKKEEKFVFFSDDDFKDLERPKREEKKEPVVTERVLPYRGAPVKPVVEEKKPFQPSLIISPVYGVLDKNYTKDEVVSKRVTPTRTYGSKPLSVDDIRVYGNKDTIQRLAVCGGSGSDFIIDAFEKNADMYITGDIKYHDAQTALQLGLVLVDAGHFNTEKIILPRLKDMLLKEVDYKVEIEIYMDTSVKYKIY